MDGKKHMTSETTQQFPAEKQVEILLQEYNNISAGIRQQIEQYPAKLTLFSAMVLGAFAFALKEPKFEFVFLAIPLLLLVVASTALLHAFMHVAGMGRIRVIEQKIRSINGGVPILEWEHKVCRTLMSPVLIRLPLRENSGRTFPLLNPIYSTAALAVLISLALVIYSVYRSAHYLHSPWDVFYIVAVLVLYVVVFTQLLGLQSLSGSVDEIDYSGC